MTLTYENQLILCSQLMRTFFVHKTSNKCYSDDDYDENDSFFSSISSLRHRTVKIIRADACDKRWQNQPTHVSYTQETTICCHFHNTKCICVLFSLSFVYVFCRKTNAFRWFASCRINLKLFIRQQTGASQDACAFHTQRLLSA